ncbi:LysM domain-containing protein [Colletotrichum tofieldiae]|uniref:LysM domain-containing protein n=1 Tax=Colletotrichum tofieldiae TaxID=708197 RepID=A0A161W4Y7_9PEZI|nr:LysM domain-containing protein [Colletotrichum tofieldiae]
MGTTCRRPFPIRIAIAALLATSGVHGIPVTNMTVAEHGTVYLMDANPNMPFDPNTDSSCTRWWDNDGSIACEDIPFERGISLEKFLRWNPSITPTCGNYVTGRSYCVEGLSSGPPSDETTITDPSRTTSTTSTLTSSSNDIETPGPTQPGMVPNCDKFYFVQQGDTCSAIALQHGISVQQMQAWNPSVDSTCSGLWASFYVCVRTIGFQPPATSSTSKSTTTKSDNEITTPTPNQPNMVKNCNKFHLIRTTTTCQGIVEYNKISMADFLKWNPSVGSNCESLWLDTYACVGVIGGSTTPAKTTTTNAATTTKAGNGVTTPTPIQPGMVDNCNKFHLIRETTTCQGIVDYNKITMTDFLKWNPSVGSKCESLWLGSHACVGVIGGSPPATKTTTKAAATTTKAGNGIATPTPIQPGMVTNCNKFHFIKTTTLCSGVLSYNSITMAEFLKWNPSVKSDCTGMQANTYACVNVIGRSPTPTTTKPSTGVTTPTPTQAGMVKGCTKFHQVRSTTTCQGILDYNKITMAQFVKWNPAVKKDCSNLWSDTYACVAGP